MCRDNAEQLPKLCYDRGPWSYYGYCYLAYDNVTTLKKKPTNQTHFKLYKSIKKRSESWDIIMSVQSDWQSHSFVEPIIPLTLTSNDLMNFFANKIVTIRKQIIHSCPTAADIRLCLLWIYLYTDKGITFIQQSSSDLTLIGVFSVNF